MCRDGGEADGRPGELVPCLFATVAEAIEEIRAIKQARGRNESTRPPRPAPPPHPKTPFRSPKYQNKHKKYRQTACACTIYVPNPYVHTQGRKRSTNVLTEPKITIPRLLEAVNSHIPHALSFSTSGKIRASAGGGTSYIYSKDVRRHHFHSEGKFSFSYIHVIFLHWLTPNH